MRKARWNEKKKGNGVSKKKKRYITQMVFGPLKEGFPIASQDRSHMSLSVPSELIVSIRLCHGQACTVHISPNHNLSIITITFFHNWFVDHSRWVEVVFGQRLDLLGVNILNASKFQPLIQTETD